jgi:hypothetical protein
MKWTDAYEHSGWTITVPVKLVHAIGAKGALLVAQLFYWKGKQENTDGWIYKTKSELGQETGLSRWEQDACTAELKKKGILETRYDRLEHRLYYRVHKEALDTIMEADLPSESGFSTFGKAEKPLSRKRDSRFPENRKTTFVINNQEITTRETTTTEHQGCKQPLPKAKKNVVVVSSGIDEEEASISKEIELFGNEFGLSGKQCAEVIGYAKNKGLPYVKEKAEVTTSEPRKNLARAFLAALRDDWQKKKASQKKEKRAPKAAEPDGWREYIREHYPKANVGSNRRFSELPPDIQAEVLEAGSSSEHSVS